MSTTTHDIVAKLWNLCNVLKDGGVTFHEYVIELTYLLFLKMAKETLVEFFEAFGVVFEAAIDVDSISWREYVNVLSYS
jgi:hypothetical protein